MGRIFVRERIVVGEGDAEPRFAVVAVEGEGLKLKFYKTHLRKAELEEIAKNTGAELVWMARGEGEHRGEQGAGGEKRHPRHRHGKASDVETA